MNLNDTIVAVSSAPGGVRSIVRLTGPEVASVCAQVFTPFVRQESTGVLTGSVPIDNDLAVDARLYRFVAPHSYTGEPLAELHVEAGPVLVEALVQKLLAQGIRPAGPGEFTARAYLHGKLDLAQAEAVNEIIASSNRFQLDAAERLLKGRLSETAGAVRSDLLDCLSLIEAGLDFSGENITFIGPGEAAERLGLIKRDLEELLSGSIRYESLIDLPAVGIAGAPNAGKSSLLNALLGHERSLVSDQRQTTRDVLSGVLKTDRLQCVLFDCAGLLAAPDHVLDELAQQAAIEALRHCQLVLFCVDAAKVDFGEDAAIRALVDGPDVFYVATKCDLLDTNARAGKLAGLEATFDGQFRPVSSATGEGLDGLRGRIERHLAETQSGARQAAAAGEGRDTIALTARHKQAVSDAIENVEQAIAEIEAGSDEVAAAMMRAACQALSDIETEPIDEQLLDRIFGRFCIGK